jgi:hypothetical protein
MFNKKLKKSEKDLGEMIDEFILHVETEEAKHSDRGYRVLYTTKKLMNDPDYQKPLPTETDMNYPLIANQYREFLMMVSSYIKQDEHTSFKDFLKNTDELQKLDLKNQHYKKLPIKYFG